MTKTPARLDDRAREEVLTHLQRELSLEEAERVADAEDCESILAALRAGLNEVEKTLLYVCPGNSRRLALNVERAQLVGLISHFERERDDVRKSQPRRRPATR